MTKLRSNVAQFHLDTVYEINILKPIEVYNQFEEFYDYVEANRILLDKKLLGKLDLIIKDFGKVFIAIDGLLENYEAKRWIIEGKEFKPNEFRKRWKLDENNEIKITDLFEKINEDLPILIKDIEREFRQILSAETQNNKLEKNDQ